MEVILGPWGSSRQGANKPDGRHDMLPHWASSVGSFSMVGGTPCRRSGVLGPGVVAALVAGRFDVLLRATPAWQRAHEASAGWQRSSAERRASVDAPFFFCFTEGVQHVVSSGALPKA